MSKYYKAEDVINTLADQWHYEATMEYPDTAGDIEEWEQNARELFADLPTIEVSEDCISREYLEEQLQQIEDITAMAHIDLGENPYDETEEITMPISTVRKIFKNAPSVVPSRAEGEWKKYGCGYICSECDHVIVLESRSNFCPKCGAKMKG